MLERAILCAFSWFGASRELFVTCDIAVWWERTGWHADACNDYILALLNELFVGRRHSCLKHNVYGLSA